MKRFKVGDKAILIKKNNSTDNGFKIGDVIEIIDFSSDMHDYKIGKNTQLGL